MSNTTNWQNLYPNISTAQEDLSRLEKWINALRSGEYKQTRGGMLYNPDDNGYCCLGVGHTVINECSKADLVGQQMFPLGKPSSFLLLAPGRYTAVIPDTVYGPGKFDNFSISAEKVLQLFPDSTLEFDDEYIRLSALNDIHNLNFEEIALIIEQLILMPLKKSIEGSEELIK